MKIIPKTGDIAKVTFVGPVEVGENPLGFWIGRWRDHWVPIWGEFVKSVEIVEHGKPSWWPLRDGDLYEWLNVNNEWVTRFVAGGKVYDSNHRLVKALSDFTTTPTSRIRLRFRNGVIYGIAQNNDAIPDGDSWA